jgi:hypothetical protein
MTRLRYTKDEEGNLVSGLVSYERGLCHVLINMEPISFTIFDQKTNESLAYSNTTSISEAKKLAKASLKQLGTNFSDEVRNSKYRKRKLDL